MKKKFLFALTAFAVVLGANAQSQNDRLYFSLRGGASGLMHPSCNGYEDFGHTIQGQASAQFGYWVSPVFAVGLEAVTGFENGSKLGHFQGKNWLNHVDVYANAKLNMNNLILGYSGQHQKFEFVPTAGIGWVHGFTYAGHSNDIATKYALDVNYNINDNWQVVASPFLAYNLTGGYQGANNPRFDARNAWWGLEAGVTYKFGNGFQTCAAYPQAEIDALNAQINELRARQPETRVVEKEVEKIVVKQVEKKVYQDIIIEFKNNSTELEGREAAKLGGIPREAKVTVIGSASKPGNDERNAYLAKTRAEVVAAKIRANGVKDVTVESAGTKYDEKAAIVKIVCE